MNRLQKKCTILTAGIHLLLIVILVVGPGFFAPKPRVDNLPVLDVIPANLIDAAFNSGIHDAQPPLPAPVITPPQPAPTPPQPVVTPPPTRVDTPEPVRPVVREPTPEPKPPEKPKIQINTQLVTRNATQNSPSVNQQNDSQRRQQQQQQARARAFQNAVRSLKNNLTSAMTIDMPGDSSVSYADYAAIVKSIYEQRWVPPDSAQSDEANTKVTVTIASDGTVVSARIISPSGDPGVDASVQRTLDRVPFIAPFPEGAKERERTYTINFNLKAKRMSE